MHAKAVLSAKSASRSKLGTCYIGSQKHTDYADGPSDEDNVEKKYLLVKRKQRDTKATSNSTEYQNSGGNDHYKTYNDPKEGGRLYRVAEGKVVYFGEAALTTYENIPEGVTWETPLLKLEQTVTRPQELVLCLRFRHFSNWEKYDENS